MLEKLIINCRFFEKGCTAEFQINTLDTLILHEKKCLFNKTTLNLKEIHLALDNADNFCTKCSVYYNKPHECITEMSKRIKELNYEVILLKQQNSNFKNEITKQLHKMKLYNKALVINLENVIKKEEIKKNQSSVILKKREEIKPIEKKPEYIEKKPEYIEKKPEEKKPEIWKK